jgi:hypothetical protein
MKYEDIVIRDREVARPAEYHKVERSLEYLRDCFDDDKDNYIVQLLDIIKKLCEPVDDKEYFATLSVESPPDYVVNYVRAYNHQPGRSGKIYSALLDVLVDNGVISDFSAKPADQQAKEYFEKRNLSTPRGVDVVLTKTYRVGGLTFKTLEEATKHRDQLQEDDKASRDLTRECLNAFASLKTNDKSLAAGTVFLKPNVTISELARTIANHMSYITAAREKESVLGEKYTTFIKAQFSNIVDFVLDNTHYDEFSGSVFFRRS